MQCIPSGETGLLADRYVEFAFAKNRGFGLYTFNFPSLRKRP